MMTTGLTGVRRSARRQGIATALKVHAIEWSRQRGMRTIETGNEENNPMFDLNVRLGYKHVWDWVHYEKSLI
jgi:GNAT superfamily N-acetyltransferase